MSIFGMSDIPAIRYHSMFGFTIWPVTRSRMRSSKSAKLNDADDAAVHLALGGQLVDDQAAVLHRQDALHADDAGFDVHFAFGELHAARAD